MKKQGPIAGFVEFIKQYHVIPLAIAVVLGNAVNDLVKSLVDGIITPFISLIIPSTSLQNFSFRIHQSRFYVGSVIGAIITFIVVAFVVYTFVQRVMKDDEALPKP